MERDQDEPAGCPSRRAVLRGGAVAGLALPLVAACGSSTPSTTQQPRPHPHGPLVSASQVPLGAGKILADKEIVVTQPKRDDYQAFSAVCTHMQCLVTMVQHGVIICPCHGSEFSIKDGSVVRGPATVALPKVKIAVENGEIVPG